MQCSPYLFQPTKDFTISHRGLNPKKSGMKILISGAIMEKHFPSWRKNQRRNNFVAKQIILTLSCSPASKIPERSILLRWCRFDGLVMEDSKKSSLFLHIP